MPDERIAIIGSGIAGLAAGWLCRRSGHHVTLFEALPKRGMDAHAAIVRGSHGESAVDAPLRVMTPDGWKTFFALCNLAGVETFDINLHLTFSTLGGNTWMRTGALRADERAKPEIHALRYRISTGLRRLAVETVRGVHSADGSEPTLAQFMNARAFNPAFTNEFVLPVLSTICTCDESALSAWPAGSLLTLFQDIMSGRRSRRLRGGTRVLAEKLAEGLTLLAGEPVLSVTPCANGAEIRTASATRCFDRVFVATQANQTDFLDPEYYAAERRVLARFNYAKGELVTHQDARFMPNERADWTALNYFLGEGGRPSMWTVWINSVEPALREAPDVFQTWQPLFEPDPGKARARVTLERPVVSTDTAAALADLDALHRVKGRRVFFCGSFAAPGVPLLESAVQSAAKIAQYVGAKVPEELRNAVAMAS